MVNLSGSCLLFHSHSSWEGSSFSFPCAIKLLFSSKLLFVSFFLNWTLILSIKTFIEKPPDFFTKSSAPSFSPNNSSISSSFDVKKITGVLGALGEEEFPSKLTFVAHKGIEANGAVQFKIKANVGIPTSKVRAGYSANAIIEIENTENSLCIKESLIQFNRFTEKPFVEILNDEGLFIKKDITIGISDGISVEVLEGVEEDDKIKVWNKVLEQDKGGDGEERPDSED